MASIKTVSIRDVVIGGGNPIIVQSMTNTDTRNIERTLAQIQALERSGCEIVRLAVPDVEAGEALRYIVPKTRIPIVADIHFDYRLALMAIDAGVSKLRINPGNIGGRDRVAAVARKAKEHGVPIRIGVNSGSLERHLLEKYGHPTAEAMVESAISHIKLLEDEKFEDIVVSLKASNVMLTIEAYRLAKARLPYPLHLGVTEAGTAVTGSVRSGVGLGILLHEGIGDTLRVSLTGDPILEVKAGFEILDSLNLRRRGAKLISCPTCGRCQIDMIPLAESVDKILENVDKPITVAVMGCAVNGPGEAREADIGIAGGKGEGLIFRKGEIIRKVPEALLLKELEEEIAKFNSSESHM